MEYFFKVIFTPLQGDTKATLLVNPGTGLSSGGGGKITFFGCGPYIRELSVSSDRILTHVKNDLLPRPPQSTAITVPTDNYFVISAQCLSRAPLEKLFGDKIMFPL